jgi:hypothetical protein
MSIEFSTRGGIFRLMKSSIPLATLLLLTGLCIYAQEKAEGEKGPPPPEHKPKGPPPYGKDHWEGKDHRDGRDHRGGDPRGSFGMSGRGPFGGDAFEKLPEAERQKVRAALGKAWSHPNVEKARAQLTKANDDFRDAMKAALTEIDPEAVAILDKMRPPMPDLPRLPELGDPGFPKAAIERLRAEFVAFSRPERRDSVRAELDTFFAKPAVQEAVSNLEKAPPEQRMKAVDRLRSLWRENYMQRRPEPPKP